MKQLITFILLSSISLAQEIYLPDIWLFKTGDDSSFKNVNYDDSNWKTIDVPADWENEGYPDYDGYAWYRVHLKVDKKLLSIKDYLLLVGKIDDRDESFLNGVKVGGMGQFPPNMTTEWNSQRIYKIPPGLLKEENVIAVRVHDNIYDGGIWGGTLGIFTQEEYKKELNIGPAPKKSFNQLNTSNGLISAVYNTKRNLVEKVWPHMFFMYDANKKVRPFLKNLKIVNSDDATLTSYLKNTHIIKVSHKNFDVYYFAPFTIDEKIFCVMIEGKKNYVDTLQMSFEKDSAEVLTKTISLIDSRAEHKYFLFTFNDSYQNNSQLIQSLTAKPKLKSLLNDELNFMQNVFHRSYFPKNLSIDERNLYEQSITILKMGQVSQHEIFEKSRGQILASLLPGSWNIGWVRDGVYSTLALNELKLFNEAKYSLSFFLNADAGYYKHFVWKDSVDYGVKSDYQISVCRYFGMGKEEADFNDNGPNIELDGFGLFLVAFSDYINKSGDLQFLNQYYEKVSKLIADPILTFVDSKNIIGKESGPWEIHLPGKQFVWTAAVSSAGLRDFAKVLKKNNYSEYQKYFDCAEKLSNGIKQNFVYDNKTLKGFYAAQSPKEQEFYDGGTIEAFTQNVLKDKSFFTSYYNDYAENLRISKRRGFSRLNNPDWYTISDWPFLDLRIAIALNNYGMRKPAKQLIDWITNYSKLNYNLIAELYNYDDENYGGSIPMVGYGAGAYILTLNNFYKN